MPRRRRANPHRHTQREDSGTPHRASSRTTRRQNTAITDITLNHFANSTAKPSSCAATQRIKKESLTVAMKKLTTNTIDNEKPWDISDDDMDEGASYDGDSESVQHSTRGHKRRRRKGTVEQNVMMESEGMVDYPLDLWFLISEYLRPEDVGVFASLCQATYYITTTTRFWLSLFRRYYHWSAVLPDFLTYWNMDHRIKHVRVCVIRALFLMHTPFRVRLSSEKPLSADPTKLLRAQCILQWHKKDKTHHKYFFKFVHLEHSDSRNNNLLRSASDASAYCNPHSGCWILEATCRSACAVPMVMGNYLYHAGVGVSANLCSHCLHLSLVLSPHLLPRSSSASTRRHQVPTTEIRLDPVSNVRLFPWWHPEYWQEVEGEVTTEEHW